MRRYSDAEYATFLITALAVPLMIAVAVLLPALFAMIALNCILDIHYPGHHVGYGEAYAIVYLASLLRQTNTAKENKEKTK